MMCFPYGSVYGQSRPRAVRRTQRCIHMESVALKSHFTRPHANMPGQWQRAETLGALINGVFLVALCMSIFLEAISRIFDPQEVSNPELVGVVGCFGLLSNLLGLVLFHEHSHSHDGHRSERAADNASDVEQGRALGGSKGSHLHAPTVADEGGNGAIGRSKIKTRDSGSSKGRTREADERPDQSETFIKGHEDGADSAPSIPTRDQSSPTSIRKSSSGKLNRHPRFSVSRPGSAANLPIYPPLFRHTFIEEASRLPDFDPEAAIDSDDDGEGELTPLLRERNSPATGAEPTTAHARNKRGSQHENLDNNRPKEVKHKGKGHDLNMRGIFLHVMGDALGNLGVIGSALIIGLSTSPWRFYSDPAISLMITVIILTSAIPLCQAASRILLQAVPVGMDVDDIKQNILGLEGILDCHHFHAWQLTDTKLVATLHILLNKPEPAEQMKLVEKVQNSMSQHGIQSSTIQVEFVGQNNDRLDSLGQDSESTKMCVLERSDGCDQQGKCCSPSSIHSNP